MDLSPHARHALRLLVEVFPGTTMVVAGRDRLLIPKHHAPPSGPVAGARSGGSVHGPTTPTPEMITEKSGIVKYSIVQNVNTPNAY